MKKQNQILRFAILTLTSILILHPNQLSAGCGGGSKVRAAGGGGGGGGGGFNKAAYLKQKKERAERKAVRTMKREILSEYMDPIDENNDGSISLREFLAADSSSRTHAEERFEKANKNGDRYLSKTEVAEMIGLDEKLKARKK